MEGTLGVITAVGYPWAPRSWASCDGQLLAISSNQALFALLGTTYGGDGRTTFALPDFRGRVMVHQGTGPGLGSYMMGQKGGSQTVTLNVTHMPQHSHTISGTVTVGASDEDANETDPTNQVLAVSSFIYRGAASSGVNLGGTSFSGQIGYSGNGQPFDNRSPFLVANMVICIAGIFPSRN